MCDNIVNTFLFVLDFVPDQYTTQELCHKVVSEYYFMLEYCHDKCKTQEMRDEAVNSGLLTLKLVPD